MKSSRLIALGVLVVALVGGAAAFLGTRQPASTITPVNPLVGTKAPAIHANVLGGGTFSLSSLKGHVVFVNFWASWCGPCVTEAPELSTFAWSHRGTNVDVLGVVFSDSLSVAQDFEKHYGSLYPSIIDANGTIANELGVTSPPTTLVIDQHGVIRAVAYGAQTLKSLNRLLAQVRS